MKKYASVFAFVCLAVAAFAEPKFEPTTNGVTVDTDRCRVTIVNGVITGILNKLTGENYINGTAQVDKILPNFPSGLGTQAGDAAYAAAGETYLWPWFELPMTNALPNQHFATTASKFEFKKLSDTSALLTYTGLSDGQAAFGSDVFTLTVEVDAATGDVLVTPAGKSPKPGVYGANLTIAPTLPAIGIHAPIFDGIKLTSDMADCLWHTKWPDYWDYAFLALEGEHTGAVGIWAQDIDLNYKDLFYRVKDGGIALSLSTMSVPPFEKLTEAKGVTWHIQAFDKSWSQAAKRFRDWRLANVKFAPRPEWTKHVAFVNSGVHAAKGWLDIVIAYVGGEHPERTVTFAPVIRAAPFDTKHWDNTPYAKFKDDMLAWKPTGAKLMAYLQPMIMWSRPSTDDKEANRVVEMSTKADTIRPFTHEKLNDLIDQHNLATPDWQAWFLNWVHSYIQDYGADGVYHDQSYPCCVDNRGLINGMRSTQGMADYFYKAATQNPNSIHGTEHMTEANDVGASLGIGSGVLWGTAPNMRKQRLQHPSPVSNSLHYPNGTLWAFPHYSDFGTRGDAQFFHWGMDQMEGRGDIAGLALQPGYYASVDKTGNYWRNELGMDRLRSRLFVRYGLRPVYPEDWDRTIRTYFKGENGEDFRYETTPWGTQFVQVDAGAKKLHYGRAHNARYANVDGGIAGWVFYNANGPTGLNPGHYYVIDPTVKRPAVYFSPGFTVVPGVPIEPSFYEGYVENGCGSDTFALLRVEPIAEVGNIIRWEQVYLHSATEPKAVFVNGQPVNPDKTTEPGQWRIRFESPATILAVIQEPAAGLAALTNAATARSLSSYNTDQLDSAWFSQQITARLATNPTSRVTLTIANPGFNGSRATELQVPFRAPDKAGKLIVTFPAPCAPLKQVLINGAKFDVVPDPAKAGPVEIACKPGAIKFVSVTAAGSTSATFEWIEDGPPVK